jgi:hypothetical protein
MIIYLMLVPVVFLVSVVPADLVALLDVPRHSVVGGVLLSLARPLATLAARITDPTLSEHVAHTALSRRPALG